MARAFLQVRATAVAVAAALPLAGCAVVHLPPTRPASKAVGHAVTAPDPAAGPSPHADSLLHPKWTTTLHPVGQPVAAGSTAVLFARSGHEAMSVVALDPSDGSRVWSAPATPSALDFGEQLAPLVVTGPGLRKLVAWFAPMPGYSLFARLTVADGETGKVVSRSGFALFDGQPYSCTAATEVCATSFDPRTRKQKVLRVPLKSAAETETTAFGRAAATTLAEQGALQHLYGELWFDDRAGRRTLRRITGGRTRWTVPLARVLPAGQSPANRWTQYYWDDSPATFALSASRPDSTGRADLRSYMATAGLDVGTGKRLWLDPGTWLRCFDTLDLVDPDKNHTRVRCRYTGTYRGSLARTDLHGVRLEGFDPRTGSTRWLVDVGPMPVLLGVPGEGGAIGRGAGDRVLVAGGGNAWEVHLDGGGYAHPAAAATYLCMTRSSVPFAATAESAGARQVFHWSGVPLARVCDASGRPAPTAGAPADAVAVTGALVGTTTLLSSPDAVVGFVS